MYCSNTELLLKLHCIYSRCIPVPDISFPATKPWSIDSDGNCLIASIFCPSDKLLHNIPVLECLNVAMTVNRGKIKSSREKGKNVMMSMNFILKVGRNEVLVHLS